MTESSIASSLSDSVGSSGGGVIAARSAGHRHGIPPPSSSTNYAPLSDTTNLEVLEYPFLTLKTYPPGFIVHIGISMMQWYIIAEKINQWEKQYTKFLLVLNFTTFQEEQSVLDPSNYSIVSITPKNQKHATTGNSVSHSGSTNCSFLCLIPLKGGQSYEWKWDPTHEP